MSVSSPCHCNPRQERWPPSARSRISGPNFLTQRWIVDLKNVLGKVNADCGNLHGVAPLKSRFRHLHYGASRRRLEQEPSTPSGMAGRTVKTEGTNERQQRAGHYYAEKAGFWETRDTFLFVALVHEFSDQLVPRRRLASSTETTPVCDMALATCATSSPTAPAAIAMLRACKAICPR